MRGLRIGERESALHCIGLRWLGLMSHVADLLLVGPYNYTRWYKEEKKVVEQ